MTAKTEKTDQAMSPEDAELTRIVDVELHKVAEDFGEYVQATGPMTEAIAVSSDQLHDRLHACLLFVARRLAARPRPLLLDDVVLLADVIVTSNNSVLLSPTFAVPSKIQLALDSMRQVTLRYGKLFATLSVTTGVQVLTGLRLVIVSCASDQPMFRRYALAPVRPDRTCDLSEWTVVEPSTDMTLFETPPRVTPFGFRTEGSSLGN